MRLVYSVRMQQSRGSNSTKDLEGDMILSRIMDRCNDNKFSVWYTSLVVTKLISLTN